MTRCAVKGCRSWNMRKGMDKKIRFFSFPRDANVKKLWIELCKNHSSFNYVNAKVCSLHFEESGYRLQDRLLDTEISKRMLSSDAVPMLLLPEQDVEAQERNNRLLKRRSKKIVQEALDEYMDVADVIPDENVCNELENQAECGISIAVQTEVDIESWRELAIIELEKKLKETEKQNQKLRQQNSELIALENSLTKIFTKGQIEKLKHPSKKISWSFQDISSATCLHSAGPRAYRYLHKKDFPLPGPSTLRRWAAKISIRPGILLEVIHLMEQYPSEERDRVCTLSFDEMKVRYEYEYDKANDTTLKPSNYVQVVMARGIFSNWKQPVFYQYDCNMTKDILFEIIFKLREAGYCVVSIVSDMGPSNRGLWKQLEISTEKTWFTSPTSANEKIFVFADIPHMVKLLRSHFLDTGYIMNDQNIDVRPIKELLQMKSTSELTTLFKINNTHIDVKNANRQKVKLATQLFSHTTSKAIRRSYALGNIISENSLAVADFVKTVNDWFDVFNTKIATIDSRDRVKAFGLAIDAQQKILQDMNAVMLSLRAPNKKTMLPFQTGILISNNSLYKLYY